MMPPPRQPELEPGVTKMGPDSLRARRLGSGRLLAGVVIVALSLLACCPAPTAAAGRETSFAARVLAVAENDVRVQLQSGRQVTLLLADGDGYDWPASGKMVYVVGVLEGDQIRVSEVTPIVTSATGS